MAWYSANRLARNPKALCLFIGRKRYNAERQAERDAKTAVAVELMRQFAALSASGIPPTCAQIARILGVHRATVGRWLKRLESKD